MADHPHHVVVVDHPADGFTDSSALTLILRAVSPTFVIAPTPTPPLAHCRP
jgi:hypothetical protein